MVILGFGVIYLLEFGVGVPADLQHVQVLLGLGADVLELRLRLRRVANSIQPSAARK